MKKILLNYVASANVCKNDRCANFALADAPEYEYPAYYLGFPALHCHKCGSNAKLLDENDIHLLLAPKIDFYLTHVKGYCPKCYSGNKIQYGSTQQKTPRSLCKNCSTVYSHKLANDKVKDKLITLTELLFSGCDFKQIITQLKISYSYFYTLLKQLEALCRRYSLYHERLTLKHKEQHIASKSKTFLSRSINNNPIYLWGVTSALSSNGYILLSNLNYTNQPVSTSSLYRNTQYPQEKNVSLPSIDNVITKYELFMKRKSFDQLPYCQQDIIHKGHIVEPVICAYSHFNELRQYYSAEKMYHYLEHEILLRSAAITVYGKDVKMKKCMIFYLYDFPHLASKAYSISKHKLGWWDNDWYAIRNSDNQIHRLLGSLTSKQYKMTEHQITEFPATFDGINRFYQDFEAYFPQNRLAQLSPSNIQLLLNIFITVYNFSLSNKGKNTTAQKTKISTQRLTISELITHLFSL